jgi:SRSO17 transposase
MAKKGEHSVGVARQYCGELGKVENCQVMVTLSVANDVAGLPIAARLYLPEEWIDHDERRAKAGIPLDVGFQTKPSLALDQIRAAHAAGVPPGVVLADEVYGSSAAFRRGVAALGLDYAVAVRSTQEVRPPQDRRRARPWRDETAVTVRTLVARLPRSAWRWVRWREGSGADLTGRFAMIRVRVGPDGAEDEQTLLVEWPTGDRDPSGYWLVTLPPATPLAEVVATAKARWWVEQGYRDLKQEVGLGDYEGRGWRGFHHHVTLTFVAYGFLVMRRCQTAQPAGGRAAPYTFPVVTDPARPPLRPERHAPTSIPTMRRRLTIGLARRLPRCPYCHATPPPNIPNPEPITLSA